MEQKKGKGKQKRGGKQSQGEDALKRGVGGLEPPCELCRNTERHLPFFDLCTITHMQYPSTFAQALGYCSNVDGRLEGRERGCRRQQANSAKKFKNLLSVLP